MDSLTGLIILWIIVGTGTLCLPPHPPPYMARSCSEKGDNIGLHIIDVPQRIPLMNYGNYIFLTNLRGFKLRIVLLLQQPTTPASSKCLTWAAVLWASPASSGKSFSRLKFINIIIDKESLGKLYVCRKAFSRIMGIRIRSDLTIICRVQMVFKK